MEGINRDFYSAAIGSLKRDLSNKRRLEKKRENLKRV